MRRTRKHNKKYRKTRRGGVRGTLKPLPLLPPSPPPSPPHSPNIRKPEVKVENKNLVPVEKYTHPWYERQQVKKVLEKAGEPPYWKRLIGIKEKTPERVSLNSYGHPIKSAFNVNKNRGFKPPSKP
jgi:hypothetical protein